MSNITTPARSRVAFAVSLLLPLLVAHRSPAAAASAVPPPPPASATCVFSNPAFAGKCTETAAVANGATAQQACGEILQCLNSVDCLKTYCQATTIRQGWALESAK